MAANLITPLLDMMFASELSVLQFRSDNRTLRLELRKGNETVFNVAYDVPPSGVVSVCGIDEVVAPYLNGSVPYADFAFVVDSQTVGPDTVRVFQCAGTVDEGAASFLANHFMTVVSCRETNYGLFEQLTAYSADTDPAPGQLSATFWQYAPDLIVRRDYTLPPLSGYVAGCYKADDYGLSDRADLIKYKVKHGSREFTYLINPLLPPPSLSVKFRNSFGATDVFHFFGLLTRTPKFTRSQANAGDHLVLYSVKEEPTFTVRTGAMRRGFEALALDLARSKQVYQIDSGGKVTDELIITDVSCKYEDGDEIISDMEFTMRRAPLSPLLLELMNEATVFDTTFDETFE